MSSKVRDPSLSQQGLLKIEWAESRMPVLMAQVVARLAGRWTCRQCGAIYHEQHNPPQVKGRCDKCGGELYQRDDDKPETVRNRLAVYNQQTAPLIEHYARAGKLVEVNGEQGAASVGQDLLKAAGL